MNDAKLMQVFHSGNNLMKELASLSLFDPLILNNEVKEFAATCILHYQVQLLWSFDDLKKITSK